MKKTIVTIGLLLIVVTAYAVGLSDKDEAKFATAVKAFKMNQNADALRLFTELNKDYPENQQIKNNYAVVLFADGKIEQAEELLSSVIESNKEVSIAFKNLNKIYDYAAAKAYSNALGTDKEVLPQKLQVIDVLIDKGTEIATAATDKPAQKTEINTPIIKNANQQIPAITEIELPAATVQIPSKLAAKEAVIKPELTQKPVVNEPVREDPALKQVIEKNINDWADVWSKGDVNAYVAFYKPDYAPEKLTHKQWLADRKLKVSPAKQIQVKLTDIVITPDKTSNDTMIATFKQSYQASKFKDNTSKQLIWHKIADKWLIEKEIVQ